LKMVCLSKHGILKSLWLSTIRSKKLWVKMTKDP
jgi:hypothetical protein